MPQYLVRRLVSAKVPHPSVPEIMVDNLESELNAIGQEGWTLNSQQELKDGVLLLFVRPTPTEAFGLGDAQRQFLTGGPGQYNPVIKDIAPAPDLPKPQQFEVGFGQGIPEEDGSPIKVGPGQGGFDETDPGKQLPIQGV